jgi:hypothetical protein
MDWQQGTSLVIVAVTAMLLARAFWKRRGRVPDCDGCSCAGRAGGGSDAFHRDPVHPNHA